MNSAEIAFPNIGIYIPHLPKGITIGGFTIAFYGMIIAAGMLSGLWLACHQAQRTGQKKEVYTDFAIYAIIFSLIGARLYYVVFSWENYKDDLLQIFNTRGGGMAIYGAVIAAVLTAIIYCKVKKYNFFLLADTAVGGLVLGQIIGRYGNFFNREAFGEYTNSLFAMRLRVDQVNPANITELMKSHMTTVDGVQYIQVHPTFLYESLWNILVLVLILVFTTKKKFNGEIFLLYLVGYALDRRTPNRSVADRKYWNRGFSGAFWCYCNRGCCSLDLREKKAGEKDIDRVKYRNVWRCVLCSYE